MKCPVAYSGHRDYLSCKLCWRTLWEWLPWLPLGGFRKLAKVDSAKESSAARS